MHIERERHVQREGENVGGWVSGGGRGGGCASNFVKVEYTVSIFKRIITNLVTLGSGFYEMLAVPNFKLPSGICNH